MAKTSKADPVTDKMIWMTTKNDKYPEIVEGGWDKLLREKLYVGRGKVGNSLVPGKVFKGPSGHGLYAAGGGGEHFSEDYEMLVTTKTMEWTDESGGGCPPNAIPGGTNSEGHTLFIARAKDPDGGNCPGYLYPPHKKCVYSYHDKQLENIDYQVLT